VGRTPRQPMMPLPHLTLREVCTHTLTVASEAVEAEALSTKGGFRNTPWWDRRGCLCPLLSPVGTKTVLSTCARGGRCDDTMRFLF
jgi:hypothetical protein